MIDLNVVKVITVIITGITAVVACLSYIISIRTDKRAQRQEQKAVEQKKIDTSNLLAMTLDFSQENGIKLFADCWIYNHGKEAVTIIRVNIEGTIRSYDQDSTVKIANYDCIKRPTSISAHGELKFDLSFIAYENVKMIKGVFARIFYLDANNNEVEVLVRPKVDRVKLL